MATIRYRKNTISFAHEDGSVAFEHHEKACILRQSFKARVGVSIPIDIGLNFAQFIHSAEGLEALSIPFSHDEIDKVVAELSCDKAPGPDGFSGLFIKLCWPIIKYDFYRLCHEFWEGSVNLQSNNDTFITLIPKVNAPECPNDFRPISLLNSCLKILTKLLANRLQESILSLVHLNQYGFLKSRTI
jgi:hypothetical protein